VPLSFSYIYIYIVTQNCKIGGGQLAMAYPGLYLSSSLIAINSKVGLDDCQTLKTVVLSFNTIENPF
jgi:hypothetical protein